MVVISVERSISAECDMSTFDRIRQAATERTARLIAAEIAPDEDVAAEEDVAPALYNAPTARREKYYR